ncbi:MAG: DoxX family membrane protein [Cyanobacteria bacterium J06627_8]
MLSLPFQNHKTSLAVCICLALLFLRARLHHLLGFSGFVDVISQKLPLALLLAIATVAFQRLGALSLPLGYSVKISASLLILFLIPASLLFHTFIAYPDKLTGFLKNLGLIGGLLMMIYAGSGAASLDSSDKQAVG